VRRRSRLCGDSGEGFRAEFAGLGRALFARALFADPGGELREEIPKLENLGSWLRRSGIEKEDVTVHLASCICMDNHHRQPCPFMNRIRNLLERKGFPNVVLGSHISQKAEARRQAGIYRTNL